MLQIGIDQGTNSSLCYKSLVFLNVFLLYAHLTVCTSGIVSPSTLPEGKPNNPPGIPALFYALLFNWQQLSRFLLTGLLLAAIGVYCLLPSALMGETQLHGIATEFKAARSVYIAIYSSTF